jgi:hypothetical protein
MKLLRSGQPQSLQVTPARRADVQWTPSIPYPLVGNVGVWDSKSWPSVILPQPFPNQPSVFPNAVNPFWPTPSTPHDARAELADLVKEVRKLNERIEKLERSLKAAEEKTGKKP